MITANTLSKAKKIINTLAFTATCISPLFSHVGNVSAKAFPGAEGYGADVTGGRGGQVIHVTNLNASGPGSLQEALSTSGPRVIVFDVSGVITADEIVFDNGDFTLAGETAPGGGITLNARLNSSYLDYSVTNFIIRHIRIRPTSLSGTQGDAIRIANNSDFILDHISTSWGSDETIDVYQSHDFTIQWSTIEESATYAGHPDGNFHNYGLINGPAGSNVSVHHNLFAHHRQRTPAIANGTSDLVNNVTYNYWRGFNHHNPADTAGFNIIGNYYKEGPDSSGALAISLDDEDNTSGPYYYAADLCLNGSVASDPWDLISYWPEDMSPPPSQAGNRFNTPAITAESCLDAYDSVLAKAGAWPRDTVTTRTVSEVQNGNGSWGREVPGDLMAGLTPTPPPTDTDNDGMPDDWETARGLDPNVADDSGNDDGDEYTNIEEYLHYRADILVNGGSPGCTEDWTCTPWSGWSECTNNSQTRTRTCTDNNSCGTTTDKPAESETRNCISGDVLDIDNLDAGYSDSGNWIVSSGTSPFGSDSYYSITIGDTASWQTTVPEAGQYEIYAWWSYHANRYTAVPYSIYVNGSTTAQDTIAVNQVENAGQWNLLGTYDFNAEDSVVVQVRVEATDFSTCADAVRFVATGTGTVSLADVILALKATAGMDPDGIAVENDVNGDGRIGLAEAISALNKILQ